MNDLHERERHIAEVLVKQGLTQLSAALGVNGMRPHRRIAGQADAVLRATCASRSRSLDDIRQARQMLSTRGDLLSPRYRASWPSCRTRDLRSRQRSSNRPSNKSWGPTRLPGWTRIRSHRHQSGKAHAARMHDGTEVVVRFAVLGARADRAGLAILEHRAGQATALAVVAPVDWWGWPKSSLGSCAQSSTTSWRDATRSASRPLRRRPPVQIPRIYWQTTTANVITLERNARHQVTDLDALDEEGIDRRDWQSSQRE